MALKEIYQELKTNLIEWIDSTFHSLFSIKFNVSLTFLKNQIIDLIFNPLLDWELLYNQEITLNITKSICFETLIKYILKINQLSNFDNGFSDNEISSNLGEIGYQGFTPDNQDLDNGSFQQNKISINIKKLDMLKQLDFINEFRTNDLEKLQTDLISALMVVIYE